MKKNIGLLYLTAFFCGMSIMAVELSATRLLAPYFGTSMIVWTVVIGLIMISLSLGNVLGGRSADKHNSMDRLYTLIWGASLWIAAIPLVGKYLVSFAALLAAFILPDNLIITGSVIACLTVFSLPLIVLGMASPYLVKLGIKDMENSGKVAGNLYATSTIGSIIGTFIPTFITIPASGIGTIKTFVIFAILLNLLSLYYFISVKRNIIRTAITIIIMIGLLAAPLGNSYAFWKNNIVYEGESLYNYLQVTEDSDSVILSTNVAFGIQSVYSKSNKLSGYYYDYGLMAPLFSKNTGFDKKLDVLILGLGTGTFAKQCKYYFPNTNTDGVEIDGEIVKLAKKHFELRDSEANIFLNDGRTFLISKAARQYDLIMVDAYHDITIPFHMATKEFFSEVKKHLNPGGVLMININMRSKKHTELTDYLTQTVKSVMKKAYRLDIQGVTNTLVFASDDEGCLDNFQENASKIGSSHALAGISAYTGSNLEEITLSKLVLTDNVAPVEVLGQKVLNDVVSQELDSFKRDIQSSGKGIWGIFEMF